MKKAQKQLEKIGKVIAFRLKKLKGVKVIGFYGSIAQGKADERSDIDMFCLCSKIPKEEERAKLFPEDGVLIKRFKHIKGFRVYDPSKYKTHQHDIIIYNNKEVSISYFTIKRFNEKMKAIKIRGYITQEDARYVGYVLYSKIIYDPIKIIYKLSKEMQIYVRKSKIIVGFLWKNKIYQQIIKEGGEVLKKAVERGNKIWVAKQMQLYLDWYLICLYMINGKLYFHFSSKNAMNIIKDFKEKPNNCIKLLEEISVLGNWGKALKDKLKLLKELIKKTNPIIEKKLR